MSLSSTWCAGQKTCAEVFAASLHSCVAPQRGSRTVDMVYCPAGCLQSGGLCGAPFLTASSEMESLRVPPVPQMACRPREAAPWLPDELESAWGQRASKTAVSFGKHSLCKPGNLQQQYLSLPKSRSRAANDGAVCSCPGMREAQAQSLPSSRNTHQSNRITHSLKRFLVEARDAFSAKTSAFSSCGSPQDLLQTLLRKIQRPGKLCSTSRQVETDWHMECEPTTSSGKLRGVVAGLVLVVSLLSSTDVSVQAAVELTAASSRAFQTEWMLGQEPADSGSSPQQEVHSSKSSDCTAAAIAEEEESGTETVTNESLVEEAWEVVYEFFFDARHNTWSKEAWLDTKEELLKRPVRSRMAAYGLIRGMLSRLDDPYTRFLTPDQFSQLTKYDVTGIGMNIGEVPGDGDSAPSLKVLGIVLGSPAQVAGVRQGDELLAVNGTSVVGKSAFDASSLIQGRKGTSVFLQIRHGPCSEPLEVTVSRQQAVKTPVFYRLQRSKETGELVGYIQLREFNALAQRDLVTAMRRLEAGGATCLVLDLQDNPGGLVQAGIEVAKVFLEAGETVVETVGRDPTSQRSIVASGAPLSRAPLLVLVNDRTASASEIVSAALHDNCRALLIGRRTFGKGLIQSIYELSDGSGVILTVGKYVTPGHSDIDGRGIEPDFNRIPSLDQARLQLGRCLQIKPSR